MKQDIRCRGCAYDEQQSSRFPCHKCTDQSHYVKAKETCPCCGSEKIVWHPQRPFRNEWSHCKDCDASWDFWGGETRVIREGNK